MSKRTVVHATDQNNTINDTIVHKTESPYQALLRRREALKLQKQANDEIKQKQSEQTT